MCSRKVLSDFPHSQHRPIILEYGLQIPTVQSIPKPRWNFKKANWTAYAKELDHIVQYIPPTSSNYDRFVGTIKLVAKKYAPRGFRKVYIPTWDKKCNDLFLEFKKSGKNRVADELIRTLNINRRNKWHDTTASLNFTHSSRKAWNLVKRLGAETPKTGQHGVVTPNDVATRMMRVAKAKMDKEHKIQLKKLLRTKKKELIPCSNYSSSFTINEIKVALGKMKINKAAGFDGIYPEFLKYSGPSIQAWLAAFCSDILNTASLLKLFKKTKIIAILKPGK